MPKLGRQDNFGYAKETTRLTPATTATNWFPYTSLDLQPVNEYFEDNSAIGTRVSLIGQELAAQSVEGSIEGKIDLDTVGYYLFHTLGAVTSVSALGATTHTFPGTAGFNNIQIPSFTAFYQRSDIGWLKANSCIIKDFEITASTGTDANIKASVIGISEGAATSQSPAYTDVVNYIFGRFAGLKFATTYAGLSAGTVLDTKSVTVKINNNSDYDWALGSLNPVDVLAKQLEFELSFSAMVKTTNFDAQFKNGTKLAFRVDFTNPSAPVIGTSLLKPLLRFDTAPSIVDISYSRDIDDFTMFDATVDSHRFTDCNYLSN
jgi:hypothetical protein